MATNKRPRPQHDLDGIEVESATSSLLRGRQQKRSRVALAVERGGSVVSDDDSGSEEDQTVGHEPQEVDFLYSSDREVEEDEIDELQASGFMQRRNDAENAPSDQGIIEEVYCRNFMCHSKLRIRLGPLINFIIGHNGSGKSAVLTALTMCLGGKATSTNRGANLKSLIKEGQDSATLAVKIKNQGENAYKPEVYGASIIVERHFSRSGTSGFKIKNADERTISTKKSELDDILDFFAFQLDNPINVLTQDMARQFLASSSAADKYKFFIRGTQLETLNNDYKLVEEHHDNMADKLELRLGDVSILKQKAHDAEAKKKRLDATRGIRDKITSLERMHAWAQVAEQEVILDSLESELRKAKQHVGEKEAAAEAVSGVYEGHNQSSEAAQRSLLDFKGPLDTLTDAYKQEKEAFDSNTAELQTILAEQRQIKENRKKSKNDTMRIERQISEEQERLADALGAAHVRRTSELEDLQDKAIAARQALSSHAESSSGLESAREQAAKALEASTPAMSRAQDHFKNAASRLSSLKNSRGQGFAAYGAKMDQLVRAINNETRWRSKPVGPLGQHVKLLKPEWSSIMETTFGAALNGFAVSHADDQRLLSQLIKRSDVQQSSVYLGSATPLDTTGKEPSEDIDTILRVLKIDSDLVRNTLIINHFIEQTVLIKDHKQAAEFMYDAGRRPNVKATIAIAAASGAGTRFEWSRSGQKSGPVRAWQGSPRMQTDHEEQIRIYEERLTQAQQNLKEAEHIRRECQTNLQQASQAQNRWKRVERDLRETMHRAEDEIEAKEAEIENNRPQDGRLQELEKQLAEAREELHAADASFVDSVVAKDRLDEIARRLKAQVEVAEGRLEEQKKNIERAEKRFEKADNDRLQALYAKNEAFAQIESAKAQVEADEKRKSEQQGVVSEYIGHASQICERVPVEDGVTPEILDDRVEKLTKDYERLEREAGGSREELTRAWLEAKKEYKEAMIGYNDLKAIMDKIKMSLNERQRRWGLFRKYISARSRIMFGYMLSERGFRGRMLVDHSSRLLDIKVEPNIAVNSDAGRQAKTLSGGEKSFSTICLLLSIWEAIGSPIRCLDEFDVFMDNVNRGTSMNMMIQAARQAIGRQFVLITPQAMNNVEMKNDVRIHRMSDPERGQTTLPFGE